MESKLVAALITQGGLGILCSVLLYVCIRLYRDLKAERDLHQKEVSEFEARYIAKHEKMIERYHELASARNAVLESLTKRTRR